ncbi:MAG: hypothetical protein WDM90_20060, partial [Ferruginibacter sp.]
MRGTHGGGLITLTLAEGDSVWVCNNDTLFCVKRDGIRVTLGSLQKSKGMGFGFTMFYRLSKSEAFVSNNSKFYKLRTVEPYKLDLVPEMGNKTVRHISPYKDMLILSIYKDGIYIYKNNHFYRVPTDEDYPELTHCHSTYVDNSGGIWVTTNNGLFRSTVSSVVESALTTGVKPFFYTYGRDDGIDNLEFNGAGTPAYALLANGRLFYPSMGGIVTFDPKELNDEILSTPISIDKISMDKMVIDPVYKDSFNVAADFNFMFIDFNLPNFGNAKNLILESNFDNLGWEKIPVASPRRLTIIGNIPSGNHQLVIRKRTGYGTNDYVYKTIIFYKEKKIYEQL